MWWKENIAEELVVAGLIAIALAAILVDGAEGKDITIAVAAGLVGYLKGGK